MTRVQLLGSLDPDTRQWNDGVLTTTAIQVNNEPDGKRIKFYRLINIFGIKCFD